MPACSARVSSVSAAESAPCSSSSPRRTVVIVAPLSPEASWHSAHTAPACSPTRLSSGGSMRWFPWQTRHSASPSASKISRFGLARKSSASRRWHCPQTLATEVTPGGVAPWLPWQAAHVGADVSLCVMSAAACTLADQSCGGVGIRPNGAIRAGSPWHWPQVVTTFSGATGDRASRTRLTPCAPWQSLHVATRPSPAAIRLPWVLVRYSSSWSTRTCGSNFRMYAASL